MRPVLPQHLVHLAKYCPGFLARAPGCVPLRAAPTTVVTARRCFAHAALRGTHRHTSQSQPMPCVRAARTVGACARHPAKDAPRRLRIAHVTYSTAFSSDSCPRLYSSAFFAGPELWRLISANASCNVRARAATLLSLRSLLSQLCCGLYACSPSVSLWRTEAGRVLAPSLSICWCQLAPLSPCSPPRGYSCLACQLQVLAHLNLSLLSCIPAT